ncbi:AI-2E family transporter [Thermophagus xiamenensis]|uniref:Predicted PurR-regulated permease PerM n=1 Tax=Thermophagus xiamenensis TaxID=385682 RepID=A0A1I1USB4_9BACT|nr:AI-2E family transporter [Thermophagus xiamenensis]SFD71693.1 Predicted PurR-regulated permease PerM [Thermophagus xiamenensis]
MKQFLKYLFLIVAIFSGVFLLWYFRSIVIFVVVSAVLSLVTRPIFDLFCRIRIGKFQIGKTISALLTVLTLWIVIILFFRFTVPLIASEVQFFSRIDVPMALEKVGKLLSDIFAPLRHSEFGQTIVSSLERQFEEAFLTLLNFDKVRIFFTSLAGFFGSVFIAAFSISFITFFFLKEEGLLIGGILLFVPQKYESGIRHALLSIRYLLRRYFLGILIQTTLVGTIVTIGFSVLGIGFNHAAIIGIISGLMNIIPYLGPLFGAVFGISVGTLVYLQLPLPYSYLSFLGGMLLVYVFVQLMDNMLFQPLIFSSSVKAHPLEIFIVILGGGYLAGVLGMFFAIPVYTIIRVIAREFFNNNEVVKKLTDRM